MVNLAKKQLFCSTTDSGQQQQGSQQQPKPVRVRNLVSQDETSDQLHIKYQGNNKSHGCNESRCLAALINARPVEHKVRPKCELLAQARDFINNFYASTKRLDSQAHLKRLAEIEDKISLQGTYWLNETELVYGAKLAWRNAARCIGRIQWSKLQVFDARSTTNAADMFKALCEHIKYATNKGNLRSAITILPARCKSTDFDWRIWNSQLIGYAGYRDPLTGSVIGDPANCEMTEVCQRLGWRGKGSRFDVLPLVLSANGGQPELFPVPEDLVLRVPIKHPTLGWFEELGLEWYALPAVANMMLDLGGLQFTAAPFSGWYMVTEIGSRDLGDVNRYNMLEPIATRMGLNTTSNASLWKDSAMVELNIAVLYSFQQAGVTIVDHHTASETFLSHLKNEQKLRGGCPADWVWLIPPTSGSCTQLFHQEMVNYHLLPSYEYMEPMWKSFDWNRWDRQQLEKLEQAAASSDSKRESLGAGRSILAAGSPSPMSPTKSMLLAHANGELTPRKLLRFKEIARAVKFTSKLFGKALSRRIKATILFATETGKSERFAHKLAATFSHAFNVHVLSMSEYDMTCLEHEALLLIVTSTFGNGDPPENGEMFAKHLAAVKLTGDTSPDIESLNSVSTNPFFQMLSEDNKEPLTDDDDSDEHTTNGRQSRKQHPTNSTGNHNNNNNQEQETVVKPLSNVRFAVFALGSTAYPHFCAFGRYVDQTLGALGAERIFRCTSGDELCGQEKAFSEWSRQVFKIACDVFCLIDFESPFDGRSEVLWSPKDVRFVPVELIDDINELDGLNKLAVIKKEYSPSSRSPSDQQELRATSKGVDSQAILSNKKTIIRNLMSITNKKIIPFTVKSRQELHPFNPEENVQTICVDIKTELAPEGSKSGSMDMVLNNRVTGKLASSGLFEAGDHVAIYPLNKPDHVQKILARMEEDQRKSRLDNKEAASQQHQWIDFNQVYTILVKRQNMDLTPASAMALGEDGWISHDSLPVTSIREALTRYLDITSPPNQEFLSILSNLTTDQDEKKRLHQMAKNFTIYEEWKNKKLPTLISLLDEFKTARFHPAILTQIPLMKPRFYSISGVTLSLTVGVVRFKTASGDLKEGLCSNYLNSLEISPTNYIYGYMRSAPAFHMPPNKTTSMILISAGTGIAPFRSFWQQRYADMYRRVPSAEKIQQVDELKSFGKIDMYFGCRNSNYILYRDELDQMYDNGVLSSVNIAFSRPTDSDVYVDESQPNLKTTPLSNGSLPTTTTTTTNIKNRSVKNIKQARRKIYVQDKLLEHRDDIYKSIMSELAHVYVCGDVSMADGVYKTLANIIGEDGENVLMNMRNLNRYHEDIFGAMQKV